jgi:hypothetical protein
MESKVASKALAASAFDKLALPATDATRSFLFTVCPPSWMSGKKDRRF